jgi:hypothetical protein
MPEQTQQVPSPPRVVAISGIIFSVLYIVEAQGSARRLPLNKDG